MRDGGAREKIFATKSYCVDASLNKVATQKLRYEELLFVLGRHALSGSRSQSPLTRIWRSSLARIYNLADAMTIFKIVKAPL